MKKLFFKILQLFENKNKRLFYLQFTTGQKSRFKKFENYTEVLNWLNKKYKLTYIQKRGNHLKITVKK